MFMLTWRMALQSQKPCLEQGVATILYRYLATKLLINSQTHNREFLQFYFDKSLTEEINIKNIVFFVYYLYL